MTADRRILARPLTREAFAPFGDVIQKTGAQHHPINSGRGERYHDLARVETEGPGGRPLVSIVEAGPQPFPMPLTMVERHPLGSQAFVPLSPKRFLVVVCPDEAGRPGQPLAFVTSPSQGVNYRRNTWHGVLTPINDVQDFLVIDRGGEGINLEEHSFETPWEIHLPGMTA